MNRDATRELLFWLPIGLISLIYLLMSPRSVHYESNSYANNNTAGTSMPPTNIDYKLVENTTITNTHGDSRNVLRYAAQEQVKDGSFAPISTFQWAQLLSNPDVDSDDSIFDFANVLANAPMHAFFFETKGVTYSNSHDTPFEFVLVESPFLYQFADAEQDPHAFRSRFQECNNENHEGSTTQKVASVGCVFFNPRGDSVLIAPMQIVNDMATTATNDMYGHLAAFVRRAPKYQVVQFWKLVMQTFVERLKSSAKEKEEDMPKDDTTVWLSTDGTGVAWLHVRLDPGPKYYDYKPYAEGG